MQREQFLAHVQKRRGSGRAASAIAEPVFRGANKEIQSYREGEFILEGPADTGKTFATLWLLDSLLRQSRRANAVMIRKKHVDIGPSVLMTYKRILELRERMGQGSVRPFGGENPQWFEYPNHARLWICGLDNPGKALSTERDWIYCNQTEELTLNDWEILSTRCTGRGAVTDTPFLFGDCNPGAENHWILKREGLKLFHSKIKDNPSIFDENGNMIPGQEGRVAKLEALTGVRKARLFLGLWVGVEGLFFEEFDDELHTCAPFPIPADWYVWAGFDHGFNHNSSFTLFTENDGMVYVIGEHIKNRWLPPVHCKAIYRLLERRAVEPIRLRQIAAGHDCFQVRGDSLGKTIADQYAEAIDPDNGAAVPLVFQKANIARVPGAAELLGRLGNVKTGIRPTLKIFNDCKRTILAVTTMIIDKDDPEDVKKVDADANGDGGDDAYDSLRYGLMARPMPRAVFGVLQSQSQVAMPDSAPVNPLDAILRKGAR